MASIEYSSTDVGAPQMGGNAAGSLVQVIKAVLVDGYGSKPALGWELMYSDATTFTYVFRPKTGSRMFLKIVDDSTFRYSTAHRAAFMTYENMFSVTNGIHACPPEQSFRNNTAGFVNKTNENTATVQKWKIIGDSTGFYLITFPTSSKPSNYNNVGCWHYFGDYVCFGHDTPRNQYNWISCTVANNNPYLYSTGHSNSTNTACIMRNPYTQVKGCRGVNFNSHFGHVERLAISGSAQSFTQDGSGRYASGQSNIGGLPVYAPVFLRDQGYNTYMMGTMPGLFDILCASEYKQNQIYYEELDEKNKLVCVPVYAGSYSTQADHCRLAFLIGEKFRHVF